MNKVTHKDNNTTNSTSKILKSKILRLNCLSPKQSTSLRKYLTLTAKIMVARKTNLSNEATKKIQTKAKSSRTLRVRSI